MIEKTIMDFLHGRMNVPVRAEVPSPPDSEYVIVVRTGGSEKDFLHTSQIAIISNGRTMLRAAGLHESVKSHMDGLTTLDEVTKVKLLDEGNVTDAMVKRHRYQGIYEITHY